MAADALAPYVARTSAAKILTIYKICRSFSYLRKDFKYMCQINVEEWHKMQIYVYVPLKNLACKGLSFNQNVIFQFEEIWFQNVLCKMLIIQSSMNHIPSQLECQKHKVPSVMLMVNFRRDVTPLLGKWVQSCPFCHNNPLILLLIDNLSDHKHAKVSW